MILNFVIPKCNKDIPTSNSQKEIYMVNHSPLSSPIQKNINPKLIGSRPAQVGFEGVEASSFRLSQIKKNTIGGINQQ